MDDAHNLEVLASVEPNTEQAEGTICLLLRDGRLFGPFSSRQAARYWCNAQELDGFCTYDLLPPQGAVDTLRP